MKLFFSIMIGLTGLIFFSVSILLADDFNSIQWREALVTVEMDLKPIYGHEVHALGILQQRGFVFYEDGQVATIQAWLTFERSGPSTSYSGYGVYDFPDG